MTAAMATRHGGCASIPTAGAPGPIEAPLRDVGWRRTLEWGFGRTEVRPYSLCSLRIVFGLIGFYI